MFKLTLAALLPIIGLAQQMSVGMIGGVPAETPLGRSTTSLPFVIGPTFTLSLSNGLSFQTGVLFHRLGRSEEVQLSGSNLLEGAASVNPLTGTLYNIRNSQWKATTIEIPLLLRYHFLSRTRTWQPFLVGRTQYPPHRNQLPQRQASQARSLDSNNSQWKINPSFGTGVSFKAGRIRIEPEVRYSYWGSNRQDPIRQNQVHFLFGLRF